MGGAQGVRSWLRIWGVEEEQTIPARVDPKAHKGGTLTSQCLLKPLAKSFIFFKILINSLVQHLFTEHLECASWRPPPQNELT